MKVVYVKNKSFEKIFNVAFAIYIFILFVASFWGISVFSPRIQADFSGVSHNIIPQNFHQFNLDTWLFNTVGNILIFLPLGILLPLTFDKIFRLPQVIFISIILSLTIEVAQYLTKLGVFDIDKTILNLLGCVLGFFALNLFRNPTPQK
ncbi:VanZ like family protein [Bacillus sp. OV166]|uniref:VanZ family protein n=1 Tax=Bacillus sp. OV166 TaxID=1882763 RepID=UPI000A2AC0F1|nr:VanZ family protein [Bacillus sp. OV166]SMQ80927.1 VanZ like family protein [Bacillus sp. OV166]